MGNAHSAIGHDPLESAASGATQSIVAAAAVVATSTPAPTSAAAAAATTAPTGAAVSPPATNSSGAGDALDAKESQHGGKDGARSDLKEKGLAKKRMERLRRSFRESFRRRKDHVPESSKPHQWQTDEALVRAGTCNFHVKYLGCVEVYESRGMQVCEEALKVLRNSRRRPVKGVLHISGDGLRVVEEETKGLIVDQTIEKVSFCAPDRNHEKGFSYICRDGTTRRWMCHGFLATKDSGERLSHAVGCAFAVCLERKQKRDKECSVTMNYDSSNATFTRTGSFRVAPLTERLQDPQECKPAEPPPVKPVVNPFAIERPHAAPHLLERQGSFRGFSQLNQSSPFKRQMSLRIGDLPSTVERQQNSLSTEAPGYKSNLTNGQPESPQPPPRVSRHRMQPSPAQNINMAPIPESSPMAERSSAVSAMCQQLSQGLSLLSSTDDPFLTDDTKIINGSNGLGNGQPLAMTATPATATTGVNGAGATPLMSRGEQWLGSLAASVGAATVAASVPPRRPAMPAPLASPVAEPTACPPAAPQQLPAIPPRSPFSNAGRTLTDPFDAEWAALATRSPGSSTNPFLQNTVVKTFEVHM